MLLVYASCKKNLGCYKLLNEQLQDSCYLNLDVV